MQRFFSALRDVALEKIDASVVIFVDEIDATRSLPFASGFHRLVSAGVIFKTSDNHIAYTCDLYRRYLGTHLTNS